MKSVTAAALAVCILTTCTPEDTRDRAVWRRTVEPRLTTTREWSSCRPTLRPGHVVVESRCAAATIVEGRCDDPISTHEDAVRLLVTRPRCIGNAIGALEKLAPSDAGAMNDLAAAYYVRAQRQDNATDLLRALTAAQHAASTRPAPPGAQFNLALILEALALDEDALQAWSAVAASDESGWAAEARAHYDVLRRKLSADGERDWARTRADLEAALATHDTAAARRAVTRYPASSQKYFEVELLSSWADAPSSEMAARVVMLGTVVSDVMHDPFAADVARSFVGADPATRGSLQDAVHTLRAARAAAAQAAPRAAQPLFERAAAELGRTGNPLHFAARTGAANAWMLDDDARALAMLDSLLADRALVRYRTVAARIQLNRLTALEFLSRYTDAMAAYDACAAVYEQDGDWEDLFAARGRHAGLYGVLGMKDAAFREALECVRHASAVANLNAHHVAIGAAAFAATDVDRADGALLYVSAFIRFLRNKLAAEPRATQKPYAFSLGAALRQRASIELRLNRNRDAAQDFAEAKTLLPQDAALAHAVEARLDEVEGELLVARDPLRAARLLGDAIAVASGTDYLTYCALLHVERARAWRAAARPADAEADLKAAVELLAQEQRSLLQSRKTEAAQDPLWATYFSRFQDAYDQLIQQLAGRGDTAGALQYAERARATEPVDLVLKLPDVPQEFRQLAGGASLDVGALRRLIPAGTCLIEYRVLDDRTYAWVIGPNVFTFMRLRATRADVRRWTGALQDAARAHDDAAFDAGLYAPYDALLTEPLSAIHNAGGADAERVIFVPDDALHGLPFAALRDPVTRRHLVEQRPIAITGSALLYLFSVLRDRSLPAGGSAALLVGDPTFDPTATLSRGLDPLPAARREVNRIRRLYDHPIVLTGSEATPKRLLQATRQSAIVHIAAHAITAGVAPSRSYLVLSPDGDDAGILDSEALRTRLDARDTRLVILGACSSSGGAPVGAEGVAPLIRPFVAAGVPGMVGSLWDVSDATAEEVLVSFHRHYRQGLDAAAALQAAQLEMLASKEAALRSALAWAPFQAIGVASSPFAHNEVITKEKPP